MKIIVLEAKKANGISLGDQTDLVKMTLEHALKRGTITVAVFQQQIHPSSEAERKYGQFGCQHKRFTGPSWT